jgi:RimJ/RimL family protein N-acetyltransferase
MLEGLMGVEDSTDREELAADRSALVTTRLKLRAPSMGDAVEIAPLADDWNVASNLSRMPHPYRRADAEEWIAARAAASGPERGEIFVITLLADGRIVGACGYDSAPHLGGFELGYWLGRPFWGRGLATEAARSVIDRAFMGLGLDHLWCSCRVTNDASRRVIQKCGFQFHSSGMLHSAASGTAMPVEHYCLDRQTWAGLKGWARAFDARAQRRLDAAGGGLASR